MINKVDPSGMTERIKSRRSELGLSYQDLADKTGLSKSTLQRYETGDIENIPISKVDILAEGLNATPEFIMGWDQQSTLPIPVYNPTYEDLKRALFNDADNITDEMFEEVKSFAQFVLQRKQAKNRSKKTL